MENDCSVSHGEVIGVQLGLYILYLRTTLYEIYWESFPLWQALKFSSMAVNLESIHSPSHPGFPGLPRGRSLWIWFHTGGGAPLRALVRPRCRTRSSHVGARIPRRRSEAGRALLAANLPSREGGGCDCQGSGTHARRAA